MGKKKTPYKSPMKMSSKEIQPDWHIVEEAYNRKMAVPFQLYSRIQEELEMKILQSTRKFERNACMCLK